MELGRVLSEFKFAYSILLIAFDLEEEQLLGSFSFVNEGGLMPEDSVIGYINMDMIGYTRSDVNTQLIPDNFDKDFPVAYEFVKRNEFRGDFVVEISNKRSRHLVEAFERAAQEFVPNLKFTRLEVAGNGESTRDLRFSDHSSFWDAGYSAISLGDGANTRNPHYHSSEDKLLDLDYVFMQNIAKAVFFSTLDLAKVQEQKTVCVLLNQQ